VKNLTPSALSTLFTLFTLFTLCALGAAALMAGTPTWAAGTSSAKKALTAAETARATASKATTVAGVAASAAATATPLALASEEQRQVYSLAHLGEYECEFKRLVWVTANPRHEGYVDLHFDKQVVTARPMLSSTGAIRLEDVKGRFLMVQIAFKSMLMDTKVGQRVADNCQHDHHREARRAAAQAPAAPGLGISQPPAATAATVALPAPPSHAAATPPVTAPAPTSAAVGSTAPATPTAPADPATPATPTPLTPASREPQPPEPQKLDQVLYKI
jgi:membrane-bound inhibitor of C-type lysozyme